MSIILSPFHFFFFFLSSSFFLKLHANTMDHTVVVVVGHTADYAVSVGFCGSNRRFVMVMQWTAACVWFGLLGFVGFPYVGG